MPYRMTSLDRAEVPQRVWVGLWTADPFGFERGPGVRLEAATTDELRELAERRGLPWTPSPT